MFRLFRALAAAAVVGLALPSLAAEPASRPKRNTAEYRLSWGASAIRADRAYAKGVAGQGVTVAVIDTGLGASAGLFTSLHPASTDLVERREPDANSRHGGQTAGVVAGAVDGAGTFGVAYRATLLAIRADRDGSCRKLCSFDHAVLARAIDYAVDHGARVIGLPLASNKPIRAIEPALARAAAKGVLIVAASGNDGSAEPVWPARYAADSRFRRSMIVAGASTMRGRFASWSNRAGSVPDRYLIAPGQNVVVDCDSRWCSLVSGTSYSVGYVAGAAALLMGRDPGLTGEAVADALLGSARDLAPWGVDRVSGRGLLDVTRALQRAERFAG